MKTVRPLAAVLLLLATACAGSGGRLPSSLLPPGVQLADLQPLESTLFEQRLQVALRLRNPNDAALPVRGVRFALHVDGKLLAQGASETRLTVPALSEALLTTTATSSSLALVRQLRSLAQDPNAEYALTGAVFLKGRDEPLPFEQSGRFDVWEDEAAPDS